MYDEDEKNLMDEEDPEPLELDGESLDDLKLDEDLEIDDPEDSYH
jgi:hypothetical protein